MKRYFILIYILISISSSAPCQNVITESDVGVTLTPIQIQSQDVDSIISLAPNTDASSIPDNLLTVQSKMESHIIQFLEGYPWKPFQNTLGISGYETDFDHPAHLFYSLSISLPYLSADTQEHVKEFLADQLKQHPPYAHAGYDREKGRARESYTVPEHLRLTGARRLDSGFGVYAFWSYIHHTGYRESLEDHWGKLAQRMEPLLKEEYSFDVEKHNHNNDEAQKLNGDLAGLIGFIRLAEMKGDAENLQRAQGKLKELLQLRINLDRVNSTILNPTRSSTKHLHAYKLTRYCDLIPEIGISVRRWSEGAAAQRIEKFRRERNAWYLAFGDRFIGGENYTNPPHFSRALFAAAAWIEYLPPQDLARYIDVPWCKGDLFFIEKCAFTLMRANSVYGE